MYRYTYNIYAFSKCYSVYVITCNVLSTVTIITLVGSLLSRILPRLTPPPLRLEVGHAPLPHLQGRTHSSSSNKNAGKRSTRYYYRIKVSVTYSTLLLKLCFVCYNRYLS